VPFNASRPAEAPMTEVATACKQRGLWPFVVSNRMHIVPPLTIEVAALHEGLSIIDEALCVADRYCT
jgi:taurine--2-oxoglutarate transaminase